jgi:hypothetical protein
MVRGEGNDMNLGKLLREEVHQFMLHRAPLLDSFCRVDLQNLTELWGCSTELGVASISGWPEMGRQRS